MTKASAKAKRDCERNEERRKQRRKERDELIRQNLLQGGRFGVGMDRRKEQFRVDTAREIWVQENPGKEPPWLEFI